MSGALCTCGCCSGLQALSPETNPAGQPALSYRAGTYSSFLARMLSQIASPNTLANPPAGPWNLASLTTRSPDDPTVAVLDAWSVVLDVLTFYQERIANEGYLRTATEHRSVLELARAIGYELNPGVAAGTYLSFIIEDVLGAPSIAPLPTGPKTPSAPTQGSTTYNAGIVTLPPGTQVVSVPPQGQTSQTFETAAELDARTNWNLMLPRITRPADFAFDSFGNLYLLGMRAAFAPGAPTLNLDPSTLYLLNPDTPALGAGTVVGIQVQQLYFSGTSTGIAVGDILLLIGRNALGKPSFLTLNVVNVVVDNVNAQTRVDFSFAPAAISFAPASFPGLSVPSSPVPFSLAAVEQYVLNTTAEDSDLEALIRISGWDPNALATVANYLPQPTVSNQGIFAFANEAAFFGHNAPQWKNLTNPSWALRGDAYPNNWDAANGGLSQLIFTDSQGAFYQDASVYLERNYSGILPESWILVEPRGGQPLPLQVTAAADKSLADYSLTGKSTGLSVKTISGQTIQAPGRPAIAIFFGQIALYAANSDGNIWYQTGIPSNWEGFTQIMQGSFSQDPAVTATTGFDFQMFLVGNDGALYGASGFGGLWQNPSRVINPFPRSIQLTGTPSPIVAVLNQFDVFVHGKDGNLYHFWQLSNVWHGPEPHTPPTNITFINSPAATGGGPTELEIFSIGNNGHFYHTGWSLSTGWWGPLEILTTTSGGVPLTYPSPLQGSPAAGINGLNPIDIFAIAEDGNLYHAWFISNKWNGMENLGGNGFVGSPSLVLHGPSNLEVFCIGTDGNLYHKNWTAGSWFGPFNLGGGNLVGSPSATAPTPHTIEVAAVGSDGNFYHFWFDGSNWHGPELVPAGYVPPVYTRRSKVHIQSDQQILAEIPVTDDVEAGTTILMLNGLVTGLTSGQAIAVSGNRADAPSQAQSEVVLLLDVQHIGGFTQLEFEPPGLTNSYARSSMTLNGNTVAATNGATIAVPEVLGSGSASQINQSFNLSRSPVTYVPAATATGAQSTIQIQVNNIIWQQQPSLFGLNSTDRAYIARQNDNGTTTVTFGDGVTGALLPTGQNNVTATYRVGIGANGNLPAGSISVLQSRPPGLRTVTNPVAATGGADAETLDGARGNAPRTVLTIDRIVSLSDYENFAAAFAGIGQAQAQALLVGQRIIIQITIAGVEGASVDPTSLLALSLGQAIDLARDPLPLVNISSYQPILFNIAATIIIDETDYVEAAVHAQVVSTVTAYFAFDQRSFAQPVTAAEIVAIIQAIPGVVAVDLSQLYRDDDPTGPSQTTPNSYLPANFASVDASGNILPAEMLLLNPVGFSLTDKAK
jgi:hypothetical protein